VLLKEKSLELVYEEKNSICSSRIESNDQEHHKCKREDAHDAKNLGVRSKSRCQPDHVNE
jgi:hypothetical protein